MRFIDAATAAKIISKRLGIPIDELVDVFADIPTAEPAKAYEELYDQWLEQKRTIRKLLGERGAENRI